MRNETPVRNSKYFSSFGRFQNLQFILPSTRNFLTFLLHLQLHYLYETWHIHSPNHSTLFAFHSGRKFCILPEIRTFQTFRYATSAYSPPRASRSPLYATLALAVYNARHNYLSMGKCNYLIYTAPVLGPHLRF